MWLYFIRRILLAIAIVIVAVILLFLMIHAVPGDPTSIMLGPRATPQMKAELAARMGLDQPIVVQIFKFFVGVLHGNLGYDVVTQRPVTSIVLGQLPYTIELILSGIIWAIIAGVPLGCYSAVRRNSLIDKIIGIGSVGAIAIPSFVMAVYSLLIFSVTLHWLPSIGAGSGFWSGVDHLILPAFVVGISWVGYIARIVRASMLEIMGENHIRMARSFGLPEGRIVARYALPLAVLPAVTIIGVGMAYLLSAAVFVEVVFARPGIGSLIIHAVGSRNYPVVMGTVLATTILFVISTTLADLLNAALDPRIRENL